MKRCLIIIDMVNGFVKEGALADKSINNITPEIEKLIKEFIKNKDDIITIQEGHKKGSKEFETFPEHCILGTSEAELIDELQPYADKMRLIRKNSTSGFITSEFMEYLKENKNQIDDVVVVGCCTDICVLNFAIPFKNYVNQYNLPINVTVPQNAVQTYDAPNHKKEEYNEMSFKLMKQAGIEIPARYINNNIER